MAAVWGRSWDILPSSVNNSKAAGGLRASFVCVAPQRGVSAHAGCGEAHRTTCGKTWPICSCRLWRPDFVQFRPAEIDPAISVQAQPALGHVFPKSGKSCKVQTGVLWQWEYCRLNLPHSRSPSASEIYRRDVFLRSGQIARDLKVGFLTRCGVGPHARWSASERGVVGAPSSLISRSSARLQGLPRAHRRRPKREISVRSWRTLPPPRNR